jgi:hypothetical protein
MDAFRDGVGATHPMERGVAENGVELFGVFEVLTAQDARPEPEPVDSVDLFRARIHPHDVAAQRRKLLRERAVAAAEIQDPLAALRRQELHDRRSEIRDETGVLVLGSPAAPPVSRAPPRPLLVEPVGSGGLRYRCRSRVSVTKR